MTMRFQAFLAAIILVATAIVAVTATALANQDDGDFAKSDRRVGEAQFASEPPAVETPNTQVIAARVEE